MGRQVPDEARIAFARHIPRRRRSLGAVDRFLLGVWGGEASRRGWYSRAWVNASFFAQSCEITALRRSIFRDAICSFGYIISMLFLLFRGVSLERFFWIYIYIYIFRSWRGLGRRWTRSSGTRCWSVSRRDSQSNTFRTRFARFRSLNQVPRSREFRTFPTRRRYQGKWF